MFFCSVLPLSVGRPQNHLYYMARAWGYKSDIWIPRRPIKGDGTAAAHVRAAQAAAAAAAGEQQPAGAAGNGELAGAGGANGGAHHHHHTRREGRGGARGEDVDMSDA